MQSRLMFKDDNSTLRVLTFGDNESNLKAVQDQGQITADIIKGGIIPVSVILCVIEGGKE